VKVALVLRKDNGPPLDCGLIAPLGIKLALSIL